MLRNVFRREGAAHRKEFELLLSSKVQMLLIDIDVKKRSFFMFSTFSSYFGSLVILPFQDFLYLLVCFRKQFSSPPPFLLFGLFQIIFFC